MDDRSRALYVFEHPRSAVAESTRALRTVLETSGAARGARRLLLTSSVSAEGKTSTTVALGISFASLGRRVVLVDGDLRRPKLHSIVGVAKGGGLAAVLSGTSTLDEVIAQSGIPGLDIIPAGASTDHPNELLASAAMEKCVAELASRYDHVVIDSPPSAMLSDAATVAKLVDGVIIVAREHAVSRRLVREVVSRLRQVGAPVLGVVVNAVDMRKQASRYSSYAYYGYRYYYYYDKYYAESEKSDHAAK
jgi:succinoglycan biosynthesis transport protein ExoP